MQINTQSQRSLYEPMFMHILDATYIGKEQICHLYEYVFSTLISEFSELAENWWWIFASEQVL